jgi:hypothetical protein
MTGLTISPDLLQQLRIARAIQHFLSNRKGVVNRERK